MQKKEKHDTCVWGQVALSGSIIAVGNTIQIWACKINGDHMLHHFELVCFFFNSLDGMGYLPDSVKFYQLHNVECGIFTNEQLLKFTDQQLLK